jgi:hypothetical protein
VRKENVKLEHIHQLELQAVLLVLLDIIHENEQVLVLNVLLEALVLQLL